MHRAAPGLRASAVGRRLEKRNAETSKQLSDLGAALGSKAPANLVGRIEEYERLKREYLAEQQAAKSGAEDSAS